MGCRVVIVHELAWMRDVLAEIVAGAPDLDPVGLAPGPFAARAMIRSTAPDILLVDAETPDMGGKEILASLMRRPPAPLLMISLPMEGVGVKRAALKSGAVEFVAMPRANTADQVRAYANEIREKIRAVHKAALRARSPREVAPRPASTDGIASPVQGVPLGGTLSAGLLADHVVAIGASTGGTEAIKEVLCALPAEMPPIVMTQHMPEGFTASFARRLDELSKLRVIEVQGGERLQPGHAYLAPGHSHLLIRRSAGGYLTALSQADPVNGHRPSVDVLFRSVAQEAQEKATGIILTGMGNDGAAGLLEMRTAGAWTIGQDQASCIVYGMPKEAVEMGGVAEVAPLAQVAARLLGRLRRLDPKFLY